MFCISRSFLAYSQTRFLLYDSHTFILWLFNVLRNICLHKFWHFVSQSIVYQLLFTDCLLMIFPGRFGNSIIAVILLFYAMRQIMYCFGVTKLIKTIMEGDEASSCSLWDNTDWMRDSKNGFSLNKCGHPWNFLFCWLKIKPNELVLFFPVSILIFLVYI